MSLATYEDARPWARAIREEVLARRMPKWSAVRGYGDFSNDPSLSPFEIALVTAWADGGAPKTASSPAADPRQPSNARSPHEVSPAQGGAEPPTKTVTVPCTAPALPKGRLVGIRPTLAEGASLRLDLHFPDGRAEPLIWIRAFDPHFAETYQLRTPALLDRGTKLSTEGATGDACRLALAILPE
jgi:hypothetical protein